MFVHGNLSPLFGLFVWLSQIYSVNSICQQKFRNYQYVWCSLKYNWCVERVEFEPFSGCIMFLYLKATIIK
jgi:hypothetical protein